MLDKIGRNILVRQSRNLIEYKSGRSIDDVTYVREIDALTHRVKVRFDDGEVRIYEVGDHQGALIVKEVE